MFVARDGGSVGYKIRGSSTDLVMLFMFYLEPTLPSPQVLWVGAPQPPRILN
jgi:hypothetical protein